MGIQSYDSDPISAMKVVFCVLASVLAVGLCRPEAEMAKPAIQDEDDRVLTLATCAAGIGTFVSGLVTTSAYEKVRNRGIYIINASPDNLMVTAMDPDQGCRTGKQFPVCVGDKAFVYKTKLAPFSHRIHLTFPNDPNGQVWGAD